MQECRNRMNVIEFGRKGNNNDRHYEYRHYNTEPLCGFACRSQAHWVETHRTTDSQLMVADGLAIIADRLDSIDTRIFDGIDLSDVVTQLELIANKEP